LLKPTGRRSLCAELGNEARLDAPSQRGAPVREPPRDVEVASGCDAFVVEEAVHAGEPLVVQQLVRRLQVAAALLDGDPGVVGADPGVAELLQSGPQVALGLVDAADVVERVQGRCRVGRGAGERDAVGHHREGHHKGEVGGRLHEEVLSEHGLGSGIIPVSRAHRSVEDPYRVDEQNIGALAVVLCLPRPLPDERPPCLRRRHLSLSLPLLHGVASRRRLGRSGIIYLTAGGVEGMSLPP
jgi:hypothetical protein